MSDVIKERNPLEDFYIQTIPMNYKVVQKKEVYDEEKKQLKIVEVFLGYFPTEERAFKRIKQAIIDDELDKRSEITMAQFIWDYEDFKHRVYERIGLEAF